MSSTYDYTIRQPVMFELHKIQCTKAERDAAPVLSAKDAKAILVCATPHIKVLKTGLAYVEGSENLLMLGRFLYKVKVLGPVRTLTLFIQNADQLIEVIIEETSNLEIFRALNGKSEINKN